MLPPETCLPGSGARSGPACSCIQKPLPCLVDQWVSGPSVPFEQPLSIQTDMEYTLDTRMFPGWDPVTGKTEPALVIDTAALAMTGATAVGAAAPVLPSPVSSPVHRTPPRNHNTTNPVCGVTNTPTSHHQHHYRTSAVCSRTRHRQQLQQQQQQQQQQAAAARAAVSGAWTPGTPGQVLPATPGPVPALPHGHAASYHPAFRPSEFRQPQQQAPASTQHQLQLHRAAVTQLPCDALPDHDIMSLIASFDAEPPGYGLDVDWLIGQTSPSVSTTHVPFSEAAKHDLLINPVLNNNSNNNPGPHHLQQQQQQQQQHQPRQTRLQSHLRARTNPALSHSAAHGTCTSSSSSSSSNTMVVAAGAMVPPTTAATSSRSMAYGLYHSGSTMAPRNDMVNYQSQFYPGALMQQQQQQLRQQHQSVKVSSSVTLAPQHHMQQHQQHMAAAPVVVPAPYAPLQRCRPVKRRLPVDSPCEGTIASHYLHQYCHNGLNLPLTAASIDLTVSKRARFSLSMNQQDLGFHAHVPSPLQARAY